MYLLIASLDFILIQKSKVFLFASDWYIAICYSWCTLNVLCNLFEQSPIVLSSQNDCFPNVNRQSNRLKILSFIKFCDRWFGMMTIKCSSIIIFRPHNSKWGGELWSVLRFFPNSAKTPLCTTPLAHFLHPLAHLLHSLKWMQLLSPSRVGDRILEGE